MKDRVHRDLSEEDISKIAKTYHSWRMPIDTSVKPTKGKAVKPNKETYQDVKGFCKSAKIAEVEKHGFVLTPGRYVGIMDAADDGIPFTEKMKKLTDQLKEQVAKEQVANKEIKKQLKKIGFEI